MSVAVRGLQLQGAEVISSNGQRVDISASIDTIDYFEDLLSPCCTLRIRVVSAGRIVNSLPIHGGEKVVLKLEHHW